MEADGMRGRAVRREEADVAPPGALEDASTASTPVRIDGPRGGVIWAFFKFLKQGKATLTYAILVRLNSPTG